MKELTPEEQAAALHFALAVIKDPDVAVGRHVIGPAQVTITIPEGALVERLEGSEGDGREACSAPEAVSLQAALLFIERSGIEGPSTYGLWKSCIVDANERKLKSKDLMPPEATRALIEVESSVPADCRRTKKTPAVRIGVADAQIRVNRLSLKAFREQDAGKPKARKAVRA